MGPGYLQVKIQFFLKGFGNFKNSQFVKDASRLLVFNLVSKIALFLGNAYAARCLGPSQLGVSAVVQSVAQQAALLYNGGFDIVSVRKIAAKKEDCVQITGSILLFRLCVGLVVAALWLIYAQFYHVGMERWAWSVGAIIIVVTSLNIVFAFQGLEKLPLQNLINSGGAVLLAGTYFIFFRPGIFLGADLICIALTSFITLSVSWYVYYDLFRHWPIAKVQWKKVGILLRESWKYWILAIVIYVYSIFQIPLVSHFLGSQQAGIFRSAFLMASGVEIFFNSINSLLLARLVVWKKQGIERMWHKQNHLFFILSMIGVPIVFFLMVMSPWIYRLFLGPLFFDGIKVFQILVLGRLVVFLGQVYIWGLAATEEDSRLVMASSLVAALSLLLNFICIPKFGIIGAAYVSLFSESLMGLSCYFLLRQFVKQKIHYTMTAELAEELV